MKRNVYKFNTQTLCWDFPWDLDDEDMIHLALTSARDRARLAIWPCVWKVCFNKDRSQIVVTRYHDLGIVPRQVREVTLGELAYQVGQQLPLLDMTVPPQAGSKAHRRKVDSLLSEARRIHEELNQVLHYSKANEKPVVQSPADTYAILQPFLSNLDHEELWTVLLNTRNRVIYLVKLYVGTLNSSNVRAGEIFKAAILESAASIIVAHNHPGGDPSPSPEDITLTRALVQAGKILDIEVLDHMVLGDGRYVSLKERGLGFN